MIGKEYIKMSIIENFNSIKMIFNNIFLLFLILI